MAKCLKCGREAAEYDFRAIEILTLHIRDLTGERRVQALGDEVEMPVCRDCAKARLEEIFHPGPNLWKRCLPFGLILALGLVLAVVYWNRDGALRLMGAAAVICGLLGLVTNIRTALAGRTEFGGLPEETALSRTAWMVAVEGSPKKAGENDVTYLPVDAERRNLGEAALRCEYALLPKIAEQAYHRLHPELEDETE